MKKLKPSKKRNAPSRRALLRMRANIQKIASALGMGESVRKRALEIYEMVLADPELNLRGRPVESQASVYLYLAVRSKGSSLSIDDILEEVTVNEAEKRKYETYAENLLKDMDNSALILLGYENKYGILQMVRDFFDDLSDELEDEYEKYWRLKERDKELAVDTVLKCGERLREWDRENKTIAAAVVYRFSSIAGLEDVEKISGVSAGHISTVSRELPSRLDLMISEETDLDPYEVSSLEGDKTDGFKPVFEGPENFPESFEGPKLVEVKSKGS